MREIKFRAWNKKAKEMMYQEMDNAQYMGNGIFAPIIFYVENTTFKHNVELMQFTGLKDKNGKDIYEGDIAQIQVSDDECGVLPEKHRGVVTYFAAEGYYGIQIAKDWTPLFYDCYIIEVIGNIYENPELLGGK